MKPLLRAVLIVDAVLLLAFGVLFVLTPWQALFDALQLANIQPAMLGQAFGIALLGLAWLAFHAAFNGDLTAPVARVVGHVNWLTGVLTVVWSIGTGSGPALAAAGRGAVGRGRSCADRARSRRRAARIGRAPARKGPGAREPGREASGRTGAGLHAAAAGRAGRQPSGGAFGAGRGCSVGRLRARVRQRRIRRAPAVAGLTGDASREPPAARRRCPCF